MPAECIAYLFEKQVITKLQWEMIGEMTHRSEKVQKVLGHLMDRNERKDVIILRDALNNELQEHLAELLQDEI